MVKTDLVHASFEFTQILHAGNHFLTSVAALGETDAVNQVHIGHLRDEGFLGVFTCVLDQLLNRDDIIEPLKKDPQNFNPVILVTPIWIGKLASPARTCIKQPAFAGKDMYLMITYNGSLTEEKEKVLKEEISAQGITLKGIYKIITKEKTEDEMKEEVLNQLETKPLLARVNNNPSN